MREGFVRSISDNRTWQEIKVVDGKDEGDGVGIIADVGIKVGNVDGMELTA